ncbi:hypothetical protein CC1G_08966 [Coprinopsis cinerea okayama7|uniref:MYND-type domain-containing protein n=1 Tax=Coprinopsis cinerea (strain Okayama-7 / 130 / ATCC MYA-4618 / FGSC 9003) TaxID=240176 RepID=A8P4S5_COPC7|nr:hypothetical protein CC1G_08966 [Coprinopsis cinerea okayama7\|eukprot:XP_001838802.2 hypothetical protein CC1G_08966 [Coprinopsis cinerea okayama7\
MSPQQKIAAAKASFRNLDSPFPPPVAMRTDRGKKVLERAAYALDFYGLLHSHAVTQDDAFLLDAIAELSLEHLDQIMSWYRYTMLIEGINNVFNGLQVIYHLITSGNKKLRLAMLTSPSVAEAVIAVGISTVGFYQPQDLSSQFLEVVQACVWHKSSRALLFDGLMALAPTLRQKFIHRTVKLIGFVGTSIQRASPGEYVIQTHIEYLVGLRDIFEQLADDWRLLLCLREERYLLKLTAFILHQYPKVRRLSPQPDKDFPLQLTTNLIWMTFRSATQQRIHAPAAVHQLVAGGLLTEAIRCLHRVTNPCSLGALTTMLHTTSAYMAWSKRVANAVNAVMKSLDPGIVKSLEDRSHPDNESWLQFSNLVGLCSDSDKTPHSVVVNCQNLMHIDSGPQRGGSESVENVKTCSGCRSLVYCSERCQEEDWANLHRFEWESLQDSRRGLVKEKIWPPWYTRIRAMQLISGVIWSFRKSRQTRLFQEVALVDMSPSSTVQDLVHIIGIFSWGGQAVQSVDAYREQVSKFDLWSPTRFEKILDEVKARKLLLYDFPFAFGCSKIHVLCAYKYDEARKSMKTSQVFHLMSFFE